MNLKELKELIELVSEKGFTEFEIERQGFRLRIVRAGQPFTHHAPAVTSFVSALPPQPAHTSSAPPAAASEPLRPESSQPAPAPAAPADELAQELLHIVKSPMPGTFYRTPSPNSEPFVKIGDHVEPDTVLCIIEAMKLMNNIEAEVTGEVVKIFVDNGQPVEYGQPLFGIRV